MSRTLAVLTGVLAAVCRAGGPAPIQPVRVCEILRDPAAYRGKTVAVIGRFSFRETGRFLSEEKCENRLTTGEFAWPCALRLVVDGDNAPHLPESFDIDSGAADRSLREARKTTALGKFRFGSVEYDRWAIVYGRVETSAQYDSPPAGLRAAKSNLEPAPFRLLYRGDGMIFFITPE